ncbi:hypothetical protein DCS_07106 [Drechmeria coniospora]|uniref:Uncharacterized protein n=1 Tax=Drechmeria coniospora TaxID=98403 RepID=A0A151GDJ5_DRECN|nr:hypothetical protein DCS_07106 [Drechmeria coniospora]KYK55144.1 hypothetical protein DCS_07106 [Drechmeria coniospora]
MCAWSAYSNGFVSGQRRVTRGRKYEDEYEDEDEDEGEGEGESEDEGKDERTPDSYRSVDWIVDIRNAVAPVGRRTTARLVSSRLVASRLASRPATDPDVMDDGRY